MNNRKELLYKLQSADFAAHDIMLYLDTHPCCQTALELYTQKVSEAKKLREEYQSKYGPLTASASSNKIPWQWLETPQPWERSK